jgi:hypothetical protein
VTGLATYPERGPVLVIGLDRTVNRSVVEPLLEHGVNAQGFTRPQEATDCFDARDSISSSSDVVFSVRPANG